MDNREIRNLNDDIAEVRSVGSSRNIEGYGIVFNKLSNLIDGRFYEMILPEAVEGIIEKSDVLVLMNHDINRGVLARSAYGKGSLRLSVDSKGVKYAFEAPTFDLGNELVEGIRRGDIKESSFSFKVARGGERMERRSDGSIIRTITKFDALYDMSPCYRGAYQDTTVALRNLDEFSNTNPDSITYGDTKPIVAETAIKPIVEAEPERRKISDEERILRQTNYLFKIKK